MAIMIGCPIQGREYVIDRYLTSLYNLEFDKSVLHVVFLVNGPDIEETLKKIWRFKSKFGHEYHKFDVKILKHDYADRRSGDRQYATIAEIRNKWLELRNDEDEYVFSIDSDVLVPPHALIQLLSHNKLIISASVKNYECEFFSVYNYRGPIENGLEVLEPTGGLIEVGMTGACYLIHKDVLNRGVNYGFHEKGEDIYFCEKARKMGFQIFADTGLITEHIMEPDNGIL